MEKIKEQLISLYDEMFEKVGEFNKNSYNDIFLDAFRKYEKLTDDISDMIVNNPEKSDEIIGMIAQILPEHAENVMNQYTKRQKNRMEENHNVNMAAYVLPILTYSNNECCVAVAEKMVSIWNEKKIVSLNLQYSTYENIAKGFKRKLCYITTAVCQYQNKPDDCYELTTLRAFRDNYLMQSETGQQLVKEYYNVAPALVMFIDMQKDADMIYQYIYEQYLCPCIQYIEDGKNEECCNLYQQMVRDLQKKYYHH